MKTPTLFGVFLLSLLTADAQSTNLDFSALEKTHDSLMAKVESFVKLTQPELNFQRDKTSKHVERNMRVEDFATIKSYVGILVKDSTYAKSVLQKADSLKIVLNAHANRIVKVLEEDIKKAYEEHDKEAADFKAVKKTLPEADKQKRELALEKLMKKIKMNEGLLLACRGQNKEHLGELTEYVKKVPLNLFNSYSAELEKMRGKLVDLEK